jgi:hypothetical protein
VDDREVRRRVAAVEERLAALEELDEAPRSAALEAVQQLVEVYGEALARLIGHAQDALGSSSNDASSNGDANAEAEAAGFARAVAGDELLGHLLLLHDLHPDDLATRVETALAALRPQLASRAATVSLDRVEDGVAVLRFDATQPLPEALVEIFEQGVMAAAPDLERIESGGAVARKGFVPLGSLQGKGATA